MAGLQQPANPVEPSGLTDSEIVSESVQGSWGTDSVLTRSAPQIRLSLSALRAALAQPAASLTRELDDDEIITVRTSGRSRGGWQDSTSLLLATIDRKGADQ